MIIPNHEGKEILLTQNKVAIVDDDDFERLLNYKWQAALMNGIWYAYRRETKGNRKSIGMHTEIMGQPPSGKMIDHIDGDGLNNKKSNLRFVTRRQNAQNMHIKKSSKYPGVSYKKRYGTWEAYINFGNKKKCLGSFKTEEMAFSAYKDAVNEIGDTVIL